MNMVVGGDRGVISPDKESWCDDYLLNLESLSINKRCLGLSWFMRKPPGCSNNEDMVAVVNM